MHFPVTSSSRSTFVAALGMMPRRSVVTGSSLQTLLSSLLSRSRVPFIRPSQPEFKSQNASVSNPAPPRWFSSSAAAGSDKPPLLAADALPRAYDPRWIEGRGWYEWWNKSGYFSAGACGVGRSFGPTSDSAPGQDVTVLLPPPNVTGALHVGHALTVSIEDAFVRWNRMRLSDASVFRSGQVQWIPGVDHAGIATQVVVEKHLTRTMNGITRYDLGREKFLEHVWDWKNQYGSTILSQLRRMGASLDWSAEYFTMDAPRSAAVTEAFVRLFEQGLVYRSQRPVNWCPSLKSVISDVEVEWEELTGPTDIRLPGSKQPYPFGVIHHFVYPLDDASESATSISSSSSSSSSSSAPTGLEVATTRLETMLGDTAIAVHPDDPRYRHLIGRHVRHPFQNRRIPIIGDAILVDPERGTGAVKVTPAHSFDDFECGRRHGLPTLNILFDDGTLNADVVGSEFAGMDRFSVRERLVSMLEALGLYRGLQPNPMRIGRCSRTGDILEPMLKSQWFVRMTTLAESAHAKVTSGQVALLPRDLYDNQWNSWMTDVRDWCVSRQLWWGHRIPAYRVHWGGSSCARSTFNLQVQFRGVDGPAVPGSASAPADYGIVLDRERRAVMISADDGDWVVARSESEAAALVREYSQQASGADAFRLEQDHDVLDTWFSSGLLPLSAQGWPQENPADRSLRRRGATSDPDSDSDALTVPSYPLTVMETGSDILFFWVARMMMLCTHFTGGVEPFSSIFLHPIVRDAQGRKMSKSLGNVIDPIHVLDGVSAAVMKEQVLSRHLPEAEQKLALLNLQREFPNGIPECGSDALRWSLLAYLQQGRQVNMDMQRVLSTRQFCNKIWQASRFVFEKLQLNRPRGSVSTHPDELDSLTVFDRWILSRLSTTVRDVNDAFEKYDFFKATSALHRFFLYDFCDNYLELVKPHFNASADLERYAKGASTVLYTCLNTFLKLAHPIMPLITDELWNHSKQFVDRSDGAAAESESLMISPYPNPQAFSRFSSEEAESEISSLLVCMQNFRSWKTRIQGKFDSYILIPSSDREFNSLNDPILLSSVRRLAKIDSIRVVHSMPNLPESSVSVVEDTPLGMMRTVVVLDHSQAAAESAKAKTKLQKIKNEMSSLEVRVNDQSYQNSAPEHIRTRDQERLTALRSDLENTESMLRLVGEKSSS